MQSGSVGHSTIATTLGNIMNKTSQANGVKLVQSWHKAGTSCYREKINGLANCCQMLRENILSIKSGMFYHLTDSAEERTEVRPYACMYGLFGRRTWGSTNGVKEWQVEASVVALDTQDRFFSTPPDFILTHTKLLHLIYLWPFIWRV